MNSLGYMEPVALAFSVVFLILGMFSIWGSSSIMKNRLDWFTALCVFALYALAIISWTKSYDIFLKFMGW